MQVKDIKKTLVFMLAGLLLVSAVSVAEDASTQKKSPQSNKSSELSDKITPINPPIPMSGWEKGFMEWLGEHFPGYYNTMLRLENNKQGYQKNFRIMKRMLGEIRNTHQRNPELGVAKMEEIRLNNIRWGTLNAIKGEKDPKKRKELVNSLEKLVKQQFENKVLVSKLTHEELRARIEELSKDLSEREQQLKAMVNNKDKEIDKQVKNLLKEIEKKEKSEK